MYNIKYEDVNWNKFWKGKEKDGTLEFILKKDKVSEEGFYTKISYNDNRKKWFQFYFMAIKYYDLNVLKTKIQKQAFKYIKLIEKDFNNLLK